MKITVILEPQPDGTVHLPIPEGLRHGKVKVTATIEVVSETPPRPHCGSLAGKIWMAPDFDTLLEDFKDYME